MTARSSTRELILMTEISVNRISDISNLNSHSNRIVPVPYRRICEEICRSNTNGNQHKRISNAQRDLFEEEEDEYNDDDVEVDYHEYSGVDYEEEEEEEEDKEVEDEEVEEEEEEEEGANHNGYYEDKIEYSDEYDDDDHGEEERYVGYTDTENKDGYDEREGEYSEDGIDQESLDHDSINEGLEFAYHTERELECVDIGLIRR
ncbi:hypothetical protein N7501_003401 [Penicillium viridicatum]|nr:hypothetical protein N7501_003401 [Penicillium viridicatum]